jgi:hypothetical protein
MKQIEQGGMMRMFDVRRCFCLMVVVCFLGGLLTLQVWAKEGQKQGAPTLNKSAAQQEQSASAEKPSISFDASTYDAGEVWEGDEVSHAFIVKNTGTAELTIQSVKPG